MDLKMKGIILDEFGKNSKKYATALEKEIKTIIALNHMGECTNGFNGQASSVYRPLCNCSYKMPAEIHEYDNKLYFRCPKKSRIVGFVCSKVRRLDYLKDYCNFYEEIVRLKEYLHIDIKRNNIILNECLVSDNNPTNFLLGFAPGLESGR
jgi:hypothetical protein